MIDIHRILQKLIGAHADELANHDGVPVAPVHLVGATNNIATLLTQARDMLLSPPPAPVASAEAAAPEEQPVEPAEPPAAAAEPSPAAPAAPAASEPPAAPDAAPDAAANAEATDK